MEALTAEAVDRCVELYQQGRDYAEIEAIVGHNRDTIREKVRGRIDPDMQLYLVHEEDLPLVTATGKVYWTVPVKGKACRRCELEDGCREAVRKGWAAGCESPLAREFDARWVRTGSGPMVVADRPTHEWDGPAEDVDDQTFSVAVEAGAVSCLGL